MRARILVALKQLEFAFRPKVVAVPLCQGGPGRTGTSAATERRGYSGRDHELEEKSRILLRELGAAKLAREIRVKWNPRMRSAAGRADYREKLISLNPLLRELTAVSTQSHFNVATNAIRDSRIGIDGDVNSVAGEIDRTLRHELAHLLAQWREKSRRRIDPHGPEWRRACRDLGIGDEARCHNLPFATKAYPVRFVYRCPNCEQKFPRVRRIRRAIACFACCRKHNGGDFDPRFRLKLIESQQKETKETKNRKKNSSLSLLSSV